MFSFKKERKYVVREQKRVKVTREKAYQATLRRNETIEEAGYNLVVRWEHERPRPWWNDRFFKPYVYVSKMIRSHTRLYMISSRIKIQEKERRPQPI